MYVTKNSETRVFKPDGSVHPQSPIRGIGTQVHTNGTIRNITGRDRGNCYLLTNMTNAYVSVDDVKIAGESDPPSDLPDVDLVELVFRDGELTNIRKNGQEWRPVL